MQFLGAFNLGQSITFRIAWTPLPGDTVTGSSLTLRHEQDGDVVGPIVGTADGANAFKAVATLSKGGRWIVLWSTTPPGGATEDALYVEA